MAFKKGNPGGPGRPKLEPELRSGPNNPPLTADRIRAVITKYCNMTVADIKKRIKDPKTRMVDMMVLKVMIRALETGDTQRLNFLWDRSVGKVKETVEHVLPRPMIITRPSGEQVIIDAEVKKVGEGDES